MHEALSRTSGPAGPQTQNGLFRENTERYKTELRYFRDIEGREVDFVAIENGRPVMFVECKSSDRDVSPALRYLKERFPTVDAWQVSAAGAKD